MLKHLLEFLGGFHGRDFGGIDGIIHEAFPDVADRLVGRVDHVFLIETVVAKFVEEDLVGREIVGISVGLADFVHGQQQRGFAQLVLMEAVFEVTQGRDGEDELFVREGVQQFFEDGYGLFGTEKHAVETVGGEFVAIRDYGAYLTSVEELWGCRASLATTAIGGV